MQKIFSTKPLKKELYINQLLKQSAIMTNKGVNKMSEELAKDYIGYKLGLKSDTPNNAAAKTLRRLAADLEREHGDLFNNMLKELNKAQQNHVNGVVFQNIAKEMFADHIINWGRIAVLYTFAGQMALFCEKHNMKAESANVPDWLSTFVNKNLSGWIEKRGGWVSE